MDAPHPTTEPRGEHATLAVSWETHARFVAILEKRGSIGSDELVSIALDALAEHTGEAS